jgi:hypothetical protein
MRAVSPTLDVANGAEFTLFQSLGQIAGPLALNSWALTFLEFNLRKKQVFSRFKTVSPSRFQPDRRTLMGNGRSTGHPADFPPTHRLASPLIRILMKGGGQESRPKSRSKSRSLPKIPIPNHFVAVPG